MYVEYLKRVFSFIEEKYLWPQIFTQREQRRIRKLNSCSDEEILIIAKIYLSKHRIISLKKVKSNIAKFRSVQSLAKRQKLGFDLEILNENELNLIFESLESKLIAHSLNSTKDPDILMNLIEKLLTCEQSKKIATELFHYEKGKIIGKQKIMKALRSSLFSQSLLKPNFDKVRAKVNEQLSESPLILPGALWLSPGIETLLMKCYHLFYMSSRTELDHSFLLQLFGKVNFPIKQRMKKDLHLDFSSHLHLNQLYFKSKKLLGFIQELLTEFKPRKCNKFDAKQPKSEIDFLKTNCNESDIRIYAKTFEGGQYFELAVILRSLKSKLTKDAAQIGYVLCLFGVEMWELVQQLSSNVVDEDERQKKNCFLRSLCFVIYLSTKAMEKLKILALAKKCFQLLLCPTFSCYMAVKIPKILVRKITIETSEEEFRETVAFAIANKHHLNGCDKHFRLLKSLKRFLPNETFDLGEKLFESTANINIIQQVVKGLSIKKGKSGRKKSFISIADEDEDTQSSATCGVEEFAIQKLATGFKSQSIDNSTSFALTKPFKAHGWFAVLEEGRVLRKLFHVFMNNAVFKDFDGHCQTTPPHLKIGNDLTTKYEKEMEMLSNFSEKDFAADFDVRYENAFVDAVVHSEKNESVGESEHDDQRCILKLFACAVGPKNLAILFKRLLINYAVWSSGLPDLICCRVTIDSEETHEERCCKASTMLAKSKSFNDLEFIFCEVKSKNDVLSDKQRLWLRFMSSEGIPNFVLKVE